MKKLLFSSVLALASFNALAFAPSPGYYQYVPNAGLNKSMNTITVAGQRLGQAATSSYSTVARANLGKAVSLASKVARGPVGLLATLVVGTLLTTDTDELVSNPDGTMTYTSTSTTPAEPTPAIVLGNMTWRNPTTSTYLCGGISPCLVFSNDRSVFTEGYIANAYKNYANPQDYELRNCRETVESSTRVVLGCDVYKISTNNLQLANVYIAQKVPSTVSCNAGFDYKTSLGCYDNGSSLPKTETTTKTVSPELLAQTIPQASLTKTLTKEQTATLINSIAQAASLQNLPIPYTVQPSDVIEPMTLGDLVNVVPESETVPNTNTSTTDTTQTTSTTTEVDPVTEDPTQEPKEVDPGIGAPSLPLDPPTANQILNPFLNLLPGFSNLSIQAPAGTCSTDSFVIYGTTFNLDSFCNIMAQNASTIQNAMRIFFTLLSLIIILGA